MSESKMYQNITEVASVLDLPAHVLRFWESKMHQIQPLKRAGGRRYYRPDDVLMLRYIQHLLHQQGYTIRGVQKFLKTMTKAQILVTAKKQFSPDTNNAESSDVSPVENAPALPPCAHQQEKIIDLLQRAKESLLQARRTLAGEG